MIYESIKKKRIFLQECATISISLLSHLVISIFWPFDIILFPIKACCSKEIFSGDRGGTVESLQRVCVPQKIWVSLCYQNHCWQCTTGVLLNISLSSYYIMLPGKCRFQILFYFNCLTRGGLMVIHSSKNFKWFKCTCTKFRNKCDIKLKVKLVLFWSKYNKWL